MKYWVIKFRRAKFSGDRKEMHEIFLWRNLKEGDHLEDLSVDEVI
jgi:hypothetical protein